MLLRNNVTSINATKSKSNYCLNLVGANYLYVVECLEEVFSETGSFRLIRFSETQGALRAKTESGLIYRQRCYAQFSEYREGIRA